MASERVRALTVHTQRDGDVASVTVRGEIDISTVGVLGECLGEVARENPRRLVIDMAQVGFMDSSGLHAFVRVRKALPEDCPVVVRAAQRQVRQVFELTGLGAVFAFE